MRGTESNVFVLLRVQNTTSRSIFWISAMTINVMFSFSPYPTFHDITIFYFIFYYWHSRLFSKLNNNLSYFSSCRLFLLILYILLFKLFIVPIHISLKIVILKFDISESSIFNPMLIFSDLKWILKERYLHIFFYYVW